MPQLQTDPSARPYAPRCSALPFQDPFIDHLAERAANRLNREPAPTRVIEVGEVTAGIAVPEPRGVRFFSSRRDFDPLDGTVFVSVEQAAKAVRAHFRQRTRPGPARNRGGRLQAV